MKNLGHRISYQTVSNLLKRNGIAPSGDRKKNMTWASFSRQHKKVLWACDFFTTEVWTNLGLTMFYVRFSIQLSTRKVVLGGITVSPKEQWMKQAARRRSTSYLEHLLANRRPFSHSTRGRLFHMIS